MSGAGADGYRLVTHATADGPTPGLLLDDRVHPLDALLEGSELVGASVLELVERWPEAHEALASSFEGAAREGGIPLDEVELLAPILYPKTIFCAGANYWDHVEEMEGTIDRSKKPKDPWFFVKSSVHSVVGEGATVRPPAASHQLDWEAELAVVIGKPARDVPADRAADVIAGFTIINDLSARDLMKRSDRPPAMTFDWVGQKSFDGAAPMGPWFTPAAYVDDWHALSVRLWVNDVLKQDSNTNQLVHDIHEQIEWLSHHLTLQPGDVIATGTPSGVGMPRGDFLHSGDLVRIEIDRCGELTTRIA